MKRSLLLFATVLIGLTSASAVEEQNLKNQKNHFDITKRYRYAQPIVFVERGIEFLVFPDGTFDFNTNYKNRSYNDSYYKTRTYKRRSVNMTYGALGKRAKHKSYRHRNRGVSISHGRDGKVRRIGNIFLNYDRYGKLKRAGSIYMNYKRNGALVQVGGLRVKYNYRGEILYTRGQVNRFSKTDHSHRGKNHHDDDDDDNHYYYKQNGKVKKHKKRKR